MSIADRLNGVLHAIDDACATAGRDPSTVRLVAVSKGHPPQAIRAAAATGQRDFGESYAQEMRDKMAALADLPEIRWHFIGRIQTNKAKWIGKATAIHAITSLRHARAVARHASAPPKVLVAVNIAGESTKSGVLPAQVLDVCRAIQAEPDLDLTGLMTLPPPVAHPDEARPWFAALSDLAARGRAEGLGLTELSMGMSHDFPVAIAHGATLVRVGTRIFGPRRPPA